MVPRVQNWAIFSFFYFVFSPSPVLCDKIIYIVARALPLSSCCQGCGVLTLCSLMLSESMYLPLAERLRSASQGQPLRFSHTWTKRGTNNNITDCTGHARAEGRRGLCGHNDHHWNIDINDSETMMSPTMFNNNCIQSHIVLIVRPTGFIRCFLRFGG